MITQLCLHRSQADDSVSVVCPQCGDSQESLPKALQHLTRSHPGAAPEQRYGLGDVHGDPLPIDDCFDVVTQGGRDLVFVVRSVESWLHLRGSTKDVHR